MKLWRHQKVFDYIRKYVPKQANILELGPGTGIMLEKLYSGGYKNLAYIDTLDYIESQEIKNLNIGYIADLNTQKVPFPDHSFDLVIALQVMEHLENPSHLKREVSRLLKRGGGFILSVPHGHNLASKIRFFFAGNVMRFEKDNEHITFLTHNVFSKVFLKDFVLEGVDYSHPKLNQFGLAVRLPETRLLKRFFGQNVYFFLKKK